MRHKFAKTNFCNHALSVVVILPWVTNTYQYLPTAYVVRRKGYVLTRVCLSVHRGVHQSGPTRGVLPARGSPYQGVPPMGVLSSRGIPRNKAGWGYPLQGWMGYPQRLDGVPLCRDGVPPVQDNGWST